jgi:hypothetical protein
MSTWCRDIRQFNLKHYKRQAAQDFWSSAMIGIEDDLQRDSNK